MIRDDEGSIVAFERGDVVWGIDPFKRDPITNGGQTIENDAAIAPRPWLVISTDAVPFHPDQYLCLSLTTRIWHDDSIPLSTADWKEGGAPEETSIMPWSSAAIQHEFLDTTSDLLARLDHVPDDEVPDDGYQGQVEAGIVNQASRRLIEYLDESLTT